VEDAYAATAWSAAHLRELGVEKLAVAGSSAGGNLAAVVSLMARERGPRIALQVLHAPVADHDLDTRSYHAYANGNGLTREGMRWFWDHYLPDGARRAEPQASPLRAAALRGLPPAIVVTAECDPLHDEGAAYAARLRSAGVPVTHLDYMGMVHGFMGWSSEIPQARRAFDEIGAAMRAALGPVATGGAPGSPSV
ncbi:MAG: alpha/beta hydrolase, partial [Chloroflexota bacterium]